MSHRFSILFVLVGLSCGCSDPEPRSIETRILCVLEFPDFGFGDESFGAYEVTPNLSAWSPKGRAGGLGSHSTPSSSSAFASFLTGVPVEEHGLRSVLEWGAQSVHPDIASRADALPDSTRTIAAVSRGHFETLGLNRGIDSWRAPADVMGRWDANELWSSIESELDSALASDAPVFLVLHFSDSKPASKNSPEPSDELLKAGLAQWIGKGGEIDEEIAAQNAEQSLAKRLSRKLLRRKEDPRRAALERCYQAATLEQVDGILGEIRSQLTKHNRLAAARFELDLGSNPSALLPRGQAVSVTGRGDFESLSAKLIPVDGAALELPQAGSVELSRRGEAFTLQLKHSQLYTLGVDGVQVGDMPFGESNVFLMVAGRSDPWPENSFAGPVLDIQKSGGRQLKATVHAPAGVAVDVRVTSFPRTAEWQSGVEAVKGEVNNQGVAVGVARVTGSGRTEFQMPMPAPSARLGVVVRLDGKRVSGSRMRYLSRLFVAGDRLDLGFTSDCWIDGALRGEAEAPESARIHAQLLDSVALLPGVELLSPEEQATLRGLDENE